MFQIWDTNKNYQLVNIDLRESGEVRILGNDQIRTVKERELGNQLVSSDMCLELIIGQESWTLILGAAEY